MYEFILCISNMLSLYVCIKKVCVGIRVSADFNKLNLRLFLDFFKTTMNAI